MAKSVLESLQAAGSKCTNVKERVMTRNKGENIMAQ
jgi:hypothetical protein